jgi:hypothetical protein
MRPPMPMKPPTGAGEGKVRPARPHMRLQKVSLSGKTAFPGGPGAFPPPSGMDAAPGGAPAFPGGASGSMGAAPGDQGT